MQNNKIYWIWLSRLIDTVKLSTLHNLISKYKTPEYIWKLTENDLKSNRISNSEIDEILNMQYRQNLENYLYYMDKMKIHIINYMSENYPQNLKNIDLPPLVLYAMGNIELLNIKSIGIVGCRNCSKYGKQMAVNFSYQLSKKGIVVVSGMARGIDTYAHFGCMKAGGKTIAVLGSGLDIIYPAENKEIFNQIIKTGGLVLSEYIVGAKPEAKHFPKRNRIISGVSEAILLVEARKRSGSFITVDFALEQGKDVYAIPGDINKITSAGTNQLIQQGAYPVTCVEDMIK